jgi:hypothetical protein
MRLPPSPIRRARRCHGQAARDAEAVLQLDPYRETAYQRLML